jgi:hypothetical protein
LEECQKRLLHIVWTPEMLDVRTHAVCAGALAGAVEAAMQGGGPALERAAERFVGGLTSIWRPRWSEVEDGDVDVTATLRRRIERPEAPPALIYRRRVHERALVVLVDLSDSTRFCDAQAVRLTAALARVGGVLAVFRDRVELIQVRAEPRAVETAFALVRRRRAGRELDVGQLPAIARTVAAHGFAGAHFVVVSDFIAGGAALTTTRGIGHCASVWLVDLFPAALLSSGWHRPEVEIDGAALSAAFPGEARIEWRQAEGPQCFRSEIATAAALRVRRIAGALVQVLRARVHGEAARGSLHLTYLPPRGPSSLTLRDMFLSVESSP